MTSTLCSIVQRLTLFIDAIIHMLPTRLRASRRKSPPTSVGNGCVRIWSLDPSAGRHDSSLRALRSCTVPCPGRIPDRSRHAPNLEARLPHTCGIALIRLPCASALIGPSQQSMRTSQSRSLWVHKVAMPRPPRGITGVPPDARVRFRIIFSLHSMLSYLCRT